MRERRGEPGDDFPEEKEKKRGEGTLAIVILSEKGRLKRWEMVLDSESFLFLL